MLLCRKIHGAYEYESIKCQQYEEHLSFGEGLGTMFLLSSRVPNKNPVTENCTDSTEVTEAYHHQVNGFRY